MTGWEVWFCRIFIHPASQPPTYTIYDEQLFVNEGWEKGHWKADWDRESTQDRRIQNSSRLVVIVECREINDIWIRYNPSFSINSCDSLSEHKRQWFAVWRSGRKLSVSPQGYPQIKVPKIVLIFIKLARQ